MVAPLPEEIAGSPVKHASPRAGQSADFVRRARGIDVVDASRVDTDLLGHSYFAQNRVLIDDIFYIVRHRHPPEQRNLRRAPQDSFPAWRFP
jgi:esterase/lipase superfamily enzyme